MVKQVECGPIDVHLGHKVQIARLKLNMSYVELSLKLGVTPIEVIEYEKGITRIGSSKLYLISTILGVPMKWLFSGFSENPPFYRKPANQNIEFTN